MKKSFLKSLTIAEALSFVTILSLLFSFMPLHVSQAALASTVETQATAEAPYSVGEEVPFKLERGSSLGTSSINVQLSSSNGGLFSGGNLSGGCTGTFEEPDTLTISANSVNKAFCYKATAPGTETITVIFGAEEETLTYEITTVAGTCSDEVLNQDETTVDAGGVCTITPPPEVCPEGTIGVPPTCTPIVEVCPVGTTGVYPICTPIVVPPTPTTGTVTICKVEQDGGGLSDWTLTLLGEKVEDVVVPANTPDGASTVAALASDTSYVAIASGTWNNNRGPLNTVDAEYSTEDNWTTYMDGFTGYGEDILELQINTTGFDPASDWGPYSGSHTYAQTFTQDTATPAKFHIYDTFYGDNTGELTVAVFPGYSGVTAEDGCVTFTEVPYGEYEVGELMQEGWENVSGLGTLVVDSPTVTRTITNTIERTHDRLRFHQVCLLGEGQGMRLTFGNYNPEAYEVSYIVEGTGETGTFTVAAATESVGKLKSKDYKQKQTIFITDTQTEIGRVDITYFNGEETDRIIRRAQGRLCDEVPAEPQVASLVITSPATDGLELAPGVYPFAAEYFDDDETVDTIQWAIRAGTCDPNTNTRAGNVDGFTDDSIFSGSAFSANVDLTTWTGGDYCFVVNPLETGGQTDTERAVRLFTLTVPDSPTDVCENLEGNQATIPEGYEKVGESNDCTLIPQTPTDVCENLEGNQASIPEGYEKVGESSDCTEIPQTVTPQNNQRNSGGGGTRVSRRLPTAPQQQVLGASTMQCGTLITQYMKMGQNNDQWEVKKLQYFLVGQGYVVPVTGVFDAATDAAVRAFQEAHRAEILTPWVTAGILTISNPTGWVYQLTRLKINNLICPGSEVMPALN